MEAGIMKYTLEHVVNLFGSFWVIYDSNDNEVFFSHNIDETLKVFQELRDE
jgi:hypothetical protein